MSPKKQRHLYPRACSQHYFGKQEINPIILANEKAQCFFCAGGFDQRVLFFQGVP
jgi:predicted SprT family Zn-dependent metalloprotease